MKASSAILACALGTVALSMEFSSANDQLLNLYGISEDERTAFRSDFWPASEGEAAVCMWKDDKLAAVSITIDDNQAPNVDWWLEMANHYGVRFTWFVITGEIDNKDRQIRGTWDLWKKVHAAGHAVQSHTVTHMGSAKTDPAWKGVDWEYGESQKHIASGIPDNQVNFFAYPGGNVQQELNDPAIAAKFYLAARGTYGKPNPAANIDYLKVSAMSRANVGVLNSLLDKNLNQARYFGGWAVLIYHWVKPPYDTVLPILDFCREHQEQIWFGLFGDVALYGQERDTSTLSVKEKRGDRLVLSLTDRMDDRFYTFPLTVKVRLPAGWSNFSGEQNGKPVTSRIVTNDGIRYGLVDAVPDRGDIVLVPSEAK